MTAGTFYEYILWGSAAFLALTAGALLVAARLGRGGHTAESRRLARGAATATLLLLAAAVLVPHLGLNMKIANLPPEDPSIIGR